MTTIDWTADANEALTLSLVRAEEDKQVLGGEETYEEFHPTFTYPIYGEDERIYGYQDLVIDLRFASGSLAQYLSVRYAQKLDASTTVDNVEGILKEFIPPDYDTDEATFLTRVQEDAVSFKPIGNVIHTYTRPAPSTSGSSSATREVVEYEVYHATWNDPGFREYHRRMQIFILLYIEAGSYISEDDDAWEFFVLYEKRKRQNGTKTYHFIGYSSVYKFYCFPEKHRLRLSQFVIVPPYQHQGHGSELYKTIYNYSLLTPLISELTVEDPAEAFEDLRDRNDLRMLLANENFMKEGFGNETVSHGGGKVRKRNTRARANPMGASSGMVKGTGKMGPPIDKAWSETFRTQLKVAGRQWQRLMEMLILMHLNPTDIQGARAYRLQVKERLYRFNFEILAQLEKEERLEKLEETFQSLREDYLRILEMIK
ncbi:acyl-CoA N-acyltransferase [Suillus subalutaceus]|uniref:acyl-CoA N-acyltransferase n=1 Tax=Suillus subalutaceus TaxID=48586 RepID=UPI001B882FEC|nr:acyl-CoA N-acyltransferase [Suillus subalutaceus]KAG1836638.1 acyl-CoA N-acyltransferase [Suillus subalutaceus]